MLTGAQDIQALLLSLCLSMVQTQVRPPFMPGHKRSIRFGAKKRREAVKPTWNRGLRTQILLHERADPMNMSSNQT